MPSDMEEEEKGNMLDKLSDDIDCANSIESDREESEDAKFGLPDEIYTRSKEFFARAKGEHQTADIADYIMNTEKKQQENPSDSDVTHEYKQALFYLYGSFDVNDDGVMVHKLLKEQKFV